MSDLFKIFQSLIDNKIDFCFQQQRKGDYYNLLVDDIHGKTHQLSASNLKEIEDGLKIMWGHLLAKPMPLPPAFPKP